MEELAVSQTAAGGDSLFHGEEKRRDEEGREKMIWAEKRERARGGNRRGAERRGQAK